MYRHIASSIKEEPSKLFVSQSEKDKWNAKSEVIHEHDTRYYHKRCNEVVLNGSENIGRVTNPPESNYLRFYLVNTSPLGLKESKPISNLFHFGNTGSTTEEYVGIDGNGKVLISILKSKIPTQDVQGFKAWLQNNNLTVVYELLHEEVYECSPIDLQTFDGTTTLSIESGPICPKTSVSVVSDIGATLHVLKEKISNLETQIADNNTSDSVVLLQSSYSADVASLQFNISVCSESRISNDSIIYDNDIYVLIKDVILNGKDLINLEYLETIIDFYTMIGKISFEMSDYLFDLLYADESYIEE